MSEVTNAEVTTATELLELMMAKRASVNGRPLAEALGEVPETMRAAMREAVRRRVAALRFELERWEAIGCVLGLEQA